MGPKNRYTFYIDDAERAALTAIKVRDGISESEQIRRAIRAWIEEKGLSKTASRRVSPRKRRG
jgi:hypothetical protein